MGNKPAVMAIVAHPDDIEFMFMGTLLMLQQKGWDIHYMTVANGNCGTAVDDSETIINKRRNECLASCAISGAIYHPSICNDLEVFHTWDIISKVLSVIRDVKPKIILTQSMDDYMEDHVNTCRVAVTAAFCRGMLNAKCNPPREVFQDDVTLYHAIPHGLMDPYGRKIEPEMYVNVAPMMRKKWELLSCHKSQKEWLDVSQGMDAYQKTMEEFMHELGERSGKFEYAEGFTRRSYLGYSATDIDPLREALGADVVSNPKYK